MSKHFPLDREPINPHHGRNRDNGGCIPKHMGATATRADGSVGLSYQ